MTTSRPEGGSGQSDERSLIIRHEEESLQEAMANPLLVRAGLSPQLPQRLARLNDVITRKDPPPLSKIGIELTPGKIPLVNTYVEHGSGIRVFLESGSGYANFRIQASQGHQSGLMVAIEDLQTFTRDILPDVPMTLFSWVSRNLEDSMDDLDIDFYSVTEDQLNFFLEKKRGQDGSTTWPYHLFEVRSPRQYLPGQVDSLLEFSLGTVHYSKRVACRVSAFNFRDSPQAVENVIDEVSNLFDKPFTYPWKETDP